MSAGPTIWLGGKSTVLHYPPTDKSPYVTACGQQGAPQTPLPLGKLTTCQRCRNVLGI